MLMVSIAVIMSGCVFTYGEVDQDYFEVLQKEDVVDEDFELIDEVTEVLYSTETLNKYISYIYENEDGDLIEISFREPSDDDEDYIYLVESLNKQGIEIFGRTEEKQERQRAEGVLCFLKEHPEIEEFVILDDQHYGFGDYQKLWENFIDTKGKGIEYGTTASKTPTVTSILFEDAIKKYS